MNGSVHSMVGVSAHDNQYGTLLRIRSRDSVDNLERAELMIIDASNIDVSMDVGMDNPSVIANNTTIGSPIDEGTTFTL